MPTQDKRLANKIGIVVGAGQTPGDAIGNGRATAVLMARHGARLLLVDLDADSVRETAEMIAREGGTAIVAVADWTDRAACDRYAKACMEAFGRIDLLHNSVGVLTKDGTPAEVEIAAVDRLFEINLKGAFNSCQAVLPMMRAQGSGSIVNISSGAAMLASASGQTAYRLSKIGLNALSHSLAVNCAGHGIRVNTVSPGLMDTPHAIVQASRMSGNSLEEARAERSRMVPLRGRMGNAWDVAYASLYLHSDEARFVTGVVMPVDGGTGAVKL